MLVGSSQAQESTSLKSLVNAERAFAKAATDKSTKEAFSANLSDSGVIFQAGPLNGKEFYDQVDKGNDLLIWEPLYADIAQSGDWGYTTGPWKFKADRADTAFAGGGYYVSCWSKIDGEWKVSLDIGIGIQNMNSKETYHYSKISSVSAKAGVPSGKAAIMSTENEFLQTYSKLGLHAYMPVFSPETRLYRPGKLPYYSSNEQRMEGLTDKDKKFTFEPIDASMAASGDMGYVYGKVIIEISSNGEKRTVNGSYLRIWKKEKGGDWKTILDLIRGGR